jgi:hypothetical protein
MRATCVNVVTGCGCAESEVEVPHLAFIMSRFSELCALSLTYDVSFCVSDVMQRVEFGGYHDWDCK